VTSLQAVSPHAPALDGRVWIEQGWRDVVFLHWHVDVSAVAHLLPPGTRPDTIAPDGTDDGTTTWVGLIGFVFADTRFPPAPAMHRLGTFVEVNVRLYTVDERGRRGVVFRSLDAGRWPPVVAARTITGLPYHWARAAHRRTGDRVGYAMRRHGSALRSRFAVSFGDAIEEPTDVETFLTARWGMHVGRAGRTTFWPNEHAAWPLHRARLTTLDDDLLGAAGLPMELATLPPDSVLFSPGVVTRFGHGLRPRASHGPDLES
jgi:uncharacterized protein